MSSQNVPPSPAAPQAPPALAVSLSPRYLTIVGGLLLLIIAMLAALWVRERARRVRAEGEVSRLLEQNERTSQALAMLGAMGRPGTEIQPFQRKDHVPVPVTLEGQRRQAYRLPASGAERFGFRQGDVILVVGEAAASSAPAPGPESSAPSGG